jgi:hypothetical protein
MSCFGQMRLPDMQVQKSSYSGCWLSKAKMPYLDQ